MNSSHRPWVFMPSLLVIFAMGCESASPVGRLAMSPNPMFWVGEFLIGKVLDEIWNAATGKPDIVELERRIKKIEQDPRWREDYRPALNRLVAGLSPEMTKDAYQTLAHDTVSRIEDIDRRLRVSELQIANHESRISQLEQRPVVPRTPYVRSVSYQDGLDIRSSPRVETQLTNRIIPTAPASVTTRTRSLEDRPVSTKVKDFVRHSDDKLQSFRDERTVHTSLVVSWINSREFIDHHERHWVLRENAEALPNRGNVLMGKLWDWPGHGVYFTVALPSREKATFQFQQ